MNAFDLTVLKFLFAVVPRWPTLGPILMYVVNDAFLKGGVLMALFWALWFANDKAVHERREILLFGFVSSASAVLLGRLLALSIPFRLRPLQSLVHSFPFPYTAPDALPRSWNSIPSDHAILYFCLATSLWMVSRRLGIVAMFHTLFVICLPRIYAGYHYPSDIAAGALLGVGVAFVCKFAPVRKSVTRPALLWLERHPASFYAFAFLWTFEVADLFRTVLNLQGFAHHTIEAFIRVHTGHV